MIRGTTPTLGTQCNMNLTQCHNYCTIWQDDIQYVLEPTALMVDDICYVYVQLTQEQTLSFEPNKPYHAQMRSVDANGFAVASFEYTGFVHDVRKDGIIEYESAPTLGSFLGGTYTPPTEEEPVPDEPIEEPIEEVEMR